MKKIKKGKGGKVMALVEGRSVKKPNTNILEDFLGFCDTYLGRGSKEECRQLLEEVRKENEGRS